LNTRRRKVAGTKGCLAPVNVSRMMGVFLPG
jgi:hypothetical protein